MPRYCLLCIYHAWYLLIFLNHQTYFPVFKGILAFYQVFFPPHVPFVLFFWSIEYNCYTIILYILIMFLMFLELFFSTFYLSVLQVESFTLLCLQHIFSRFTDSSVILLLLISSSEVFTAETLFFISVCLLLSRLFDFIVCVSLLRLLFVISSMFPLYT